MHASAMFYGYIIYAIDNSRVKAVLEIILCGLGFALIRCNFHNLFDVCGAVVFTLAEIAVYHFITKKFGKKFMGISVILFSTLILFILGYFYKIYSFVWSAFYILLSFICCMQIFTINQEGWVRRVLSLVITITIGFTINLLSNALGLESIVYIGKLKFIFLSFAIFLSMPTSRSIERFLVNSPKQESI
jgi:hypothetical protein